MLDSAFVCLALAAPISPAFHGVASSEILELAEPSPSVGGQEGATVESIETSATKSRSRWDGSGKLFLGALGGGASGGLILGGLGYVLGSGLDGADRCGGGGCNIALGAMLGTFGGGLFGGLWGSAYAVQKLSPDHHPTRSLSPAMAGGAIGAGVGAAVQAFALGDAHPAVRLVPVLIGIASGAVTNDRLNADPASFSVAPWSPRPGMQGARVGLAF